MGEMERQISTFNDYETFVDETSADYSSEIFNKQEIAELEQKNKSLVGGIMSMRKPKRELSKAERKLKREEAAQRRITTMMAVIVGTFALFCFHLLLCSFFFHTVRQSPIIWETTRISLR